MESSPQPSSSVVADYCSRGILQYCSLANHLVPSPPLSTDDGDDSPSGSRVSPLVIGLITVLAAAILLLSCCIFVAYKYCRQRRASRLSQNQEEDDIAAAASLAPPSPNSIGGLDEQFISSLPVFKYRRGDGLAGSSTECVVCLSEFIEDESLRLMTNCQHAFHPLCIDTWLRSHPNCPMCRASVMAAPPPPPLPIRRPLPTVSRMRVQSGGDVVVVDGSSRNRVWELNLHPPETAIPVDGDVDLCLVV